MPGLPLLFQMHSWLLGKGSYSVASTPGIHCQKTASQHVQILALVWAALLTLYWFGIWGLGRLPGSHSSCYLFWVIASSCNE